MHAPNRNVVLFLLLSAMLLPAWAARGQGLVVIDRHPEIAPPAVIHPPQPRPIPGAPIPGAVLELRQHQVTVTIKDQLATTRIEHIFHNPTGQRLEGAFLFPLPPEANLDTFQIDVNGKMTEAELLDADKARTVYEDIVRSMRDPALLEYSDHALLKARVFPIEPNSDKRITLEYTHLLPSDTGTAEYVYPITARIRRADFSRHGNSGGTSGDKISLKIELQLSKPIANLYCPTHSVEIKRLSDHKAIIGYESDNLGESDLKLYISPKVSEGDVGLTLLTYRDGNPDPLSSTDGYFLLLASPTVDAKDTKPLPKDITFVLDTSGSMQGDKLAQAKKALKFCIENLNKEDRFQIVRFSTDSDTLFDQISPADDEHRNAAYAYTDNLKPIGGTAIEEALTKAIAPLTDPARRADFSRHDQPSGDTSGDTSGGRPYYIIFLTDGKPTIGETDTDRLIHNAITRFNVQDHVRVFCFGIGTDINTKLLDKITETTRATTEYVLPDEDIEIKVSRFYTKISEPVLANPAISLSPMPSVRLMKMTRLRATYPEDLPDLFKGDQVVAVGRYSDPSGGILLHMTGDIGSQQQTFTIDGAFVENAIDHTFIPRLWATRRIGYLLDEMRLHGEKDELKDEVVQLARAFGIVTPYTSYLIVEDEQARNVPVARRTMQEIGGDAELRDRQRLAYDAMTREEAGAGSIRGSQSNLALKSAATAPAATQSANEYAMKPGSSVASTPLIQQTVYRAGKTFVRNGEQWIDTAAQRADIAQQQPQRIAFNSDEYFALTRTNKIAAQWLSVSNNLQIVIDGRLYEVVME